MRFFFPRSSRLKRGWEFDVVFRTGGRLRGELVRLLFVKGAEGAPRVGMAVGKRQGKSHDRNRGRRILREGFRRLLPWIRRDVWIVAGLSRAGMKAGAKEIYAETASLLEGAGLMEPGWPGPDWEGRSPCPDER